MKKSILFILTLVAAPVFAQDHIYLRDGVKIKAKVTQVNETNITYKNHDNLSGPDYVLHRSKVAVIVYENGMHEVYSEEEATHKRHREPDEFETDSTLGKNIIGINYFDIIFSNVTLHYERLLCRKQIGLKTGLSLGVGRYTSFMGGDRSDIHGYFALNYYPLKQKRVTYLCGPMIIAGTGESYYYSYYDPIPYSSRNYYGFYVNNGMIINITKNFSFSTILGIGLADRFSNGEFYGHANLEINTCIRF